MDILRTDEDDVAILPKSKTRNLAYPEAMMNQDITGGAAELSVDRPTTAAEASRLYDLLMTSLDLVCEKEPLRSLLVEALYRAAIILDVSGTGTGTKGIN